MTNNSLLVAFWFKGIFPPEPGSEKGTQAGPLTALSFFVAADPEGKKYCEKLLKLSWLTVVQKCPNVVTKLKGGESKLMRF
jgi:hypothetical protein